MEGYIKNRKTIQDSSRGQPLISTEQFKMEDTQSVRLWKTAAKLQME
jgi:hypothetical protein